MSETSAFEAWSQGRDATHRTRNLDTHLTHGCIQLFCHFWRQRSGGAQFGRPAKSAFPVLSEAADRHRRGDER